MLLEFIHLELFFICVCMLRRVTCNACECGETNIKVKIKVKSGLQIIARRTDELFMLIYLDSCLLFKKNLESGVLQLSKKNALLQV